MIQIAPDAVMHTQLEEPILQIRDLKVHYDTPNGRVHAVDGVTLSVRRGERFGLVGESGCGKTTTATAILRLLPPSAKIVDGEILLDQVNLADVDEETLRKVRWNKISLIPQGSMNSLNPIMRIGSQFEDIFATHARHLSRETVSEQITSLLTTVGLPGSVAAMYPHELSGGMKQRVCVAMAIALRPSLIVADEPTSALDVVVQGMVMRTLITVQEKLDAAMVLIGHDMGLMAQVVHRIAIMYAGEIVEVGTVRQIFKNPQHPYTQALVSAVPHIGGAKRLITLPGLPPRLLNPPQGCRFSARCARSMSVCETNHPQLLPVASGALAACHLYRHGEEA